MGGGGGAVLAKLGKGVVRPRRLEEEGGRFRWLWCGLGLGLGIAELG